MKKMVLFTLFAAGLFPAAGCSDAPAVSELADAEKTAWLFLQKQNWEKTADPAQPDTRFVTAGHTSVWLNRSHAGEDVIAVSFSEKSPAVTAPPVLLMDPATGQVVGYMPSE